MLSRTLSRAPSAGWSARPRGSAHGWCRPASPAGQPAGQQRVEGLLDASLALQCAGGGGVGEPDDVGGQIPVRVDARVRRGQRDARQVERADQRGGGGRDGPLQHDVVRRDRRRVGQQGQDRRGCHAERASQRAGHRAERPLRLGDHRRVGVDQVGLDGHRQRGAVRAGYGTPDGWDGDRGQPVASATAWIDELSMAWSWEQAGHQREHEADAQHGDARARRCGLPRVSRPRRRGARPPPALPPGAWVSWDGLSRAGGRRGTRGGRAYPSLARGRPPRLSAPGRGSRPCPASPQAARAAVT